VYDLNIISWRLLTTVTPRYCTLKIFSDQRQKNIPYVSHGYIEIKPGHEAERRALGITSENMKRCHVEVCHAFHLPMCGFERSQNHQ
jgi:hypothetical protein